MKSLDLPIKIIEKSGKTIKQHLVRSNPFPRKQCSPSECNVCHTNPSVVCKKRGTVYRVNCLGEESNCKSFYIGESARSIGTRFKEHVEKFENNDPTSAFYKHSIEKHDGNHPSLGLEILSVHPGDAMLRQITESVYIKNYKPDLNNKEEWSCANVPRLRKDSPQ